jgi:F-type H+-transporting ATPase subunit b
MKWTCSVAFPSLLPAIAFAAEESHAAHGHGGIPWATLLFSTINTLIFIYIIKRFAWASIRDWVADRRRQIVTTLEQAARAKRDAEQLKAEWEQRLANLGQELDEMRRLAQAETERERDRILAAAREAAEAIRRDAHRAAEQEVRTAQAQLREEVARQALAIASDQARQRLTAADHERFLTEFLNQVRP